MKIQSQYLQPYVNHVYERIGQNKRAITPGSFIAMRTKGEAKKWTCRYANSLVNSLRRIGWKPGRSVLGSIAYYPEGNEAH